MHCFCLDTSIQIKNRPCSVQLFSCVTYLQRNGICKVENSYSLVLPQAINVMSFVTLQTLMMSLQKDTLQGLNGILLIKSVILWSSVERKGYNLFPSCFLKPRYYTFLFCTTFRILFIIYRKFGCKIILIL